MCGVMLFVACLPALGKIRSTYVADLKTKVRPPASVSFAAYITTDNIDRQLNFIKTAALDAFFYSFRDLIMKHVLGYSLVITSDV